MRCQAIKRYRSGIPLMDILYHTTCQYGGEWGTGVYCPGYEMGQTFEQSSECLPSIDKQTQRHEASE